MSTVLLVPVLNERPTAEVVAALVTGCLDAGIVERAVVLDGGSTDGGPAVLRSLGVEVLDAAALPPGTQRRGKGDSVWRGVAAVEADRYVTVDGDVRGLRVADVAALRDALDGDGVHLAKASFARRQRDGEAEVLLGGRVTELLARPLLARFAPDLAHVGEPLSGQQSFTREVATTLPMLSGYGLEMGLLLAVRARFGAEAIVDVPIRSLSHDRKSDASLAPMARQVLAAATWGLGLHADGTHDDVARQPDDVVVVLGPHTTVRA